jgi:hypothetical protein
MATAGDIAKRALASILVAGSEAELFGDDYDDILFELNIFMAELEVRGNDLGYTEVTSPSDEVTIPTGALSGVIANLALRIAPQYGGHVSDALIAQADAGMKAINSMTITIGDSLLPGNLNVGVADQSAFGSDFYTGG